jgi:hypothetical protein
MVEAVALAILAMSTPSPVPSPASAASSNGVIVLREIVYKVSSVSTRALTRETFGGADPNPNAVGNPQVPTVAYAPAPTAVRNATAENGTIVIDVFAVDRDVISANVTEHFANRSEPRTYGAIVSPTGVVQFNVPDPSPSASALLPMFGIDFLATNTYDPGYAWHVDYRTSTIDLDKVFTIESQDGPYLTLGEREMIHITAAEGMNFLGTGQMKYKPSLLVPISGDFEERGMRGTMDTTDELKTSVHFERVSDTRDGVPAAQ